MPVDRRVAEHLARGGVADAAELRDTGEDVVDALVEEQVGAIERVVVRDRVARSRPRVHDAPRVAEHDARNRHRREAGEHADLVAGGFRVEIAHHDRRERSGPALAHELAERGAPAPAARALWSSRQLKCAQKTWIGPRGPAISANTRQSLLALVVGRARTFAREQSNDVARDRPARDHRIARLHAVRERQVGRPHRSLEPELRRELLGLVVRAVVPHLLQTDDVGADVAAASC